MSISTCRVAPIPLVHNVLTNILTSYHCLSPFLTIYIGTGQRQGTSKTSTTTGYSTPQYSKEGYHNTHPTADSTRGAGTYSTSKSKQKNNNTQPNRQRWEAATNGGIPTAHK